MTEPAVWARIRSDAFHADATVIIRDLAPEGHRVVTVRHLRTAHYAVYRVRTGDGADHVVRIGAVSPDDDAPADNTAFAGTSAESPSGQLREKIIAEAFAAAGADVVAPKHYARRDGLEALWLPYLQDTGRPVTAGQWHRTLTGLHAWQPGTELPVFTNRSKTFARLEALPEATAIGLRNRYDTALEALFETATAWSVVHGDAHAGNVINTGDRAALFDLDTSCWAPSVWDLTHLLHRAGTGANTGYTAAELTGLFPFTRAEVSAAVALRGVASLVAKAHRDHAARAITPSPALVAA
ncbi:MAG TPA: phosphotransferase [Arthrobacter sp.]